MWQVDLKGNKMKISFITPVYNCEKYLAECVKGRERRNLPNYEIILIDDGSTDGTDAICDELVYQNNNIKCIHQENQGVSAARNCGIEVSTGDYIIFLDADDSIEPQKISDLLKIMEEDPSIHMAVFGLTFDYYYKGSLYRRDELGLPFDGKIEKSAWIKYIPELYKQNALSPVWNKIIKRTVLDENQLKLKRNMFLYEDLEFSLRCLACCDSIYFSPDIIYHYRQPEDKGNAGRRLKDMEHISVLVSQIEAVLDELIEKQHAEIYQEQIRNILLDLYLVLAREKISVSNVKDIVQICKDFSEWVKKRKMLIPERQKKFVNCLLERKVFYLILKRNYTVVRHKIAVKVKNTAYYKKRKSGGPD